MTLTRAQLASTPTCTGRACVGSVPIPSSPKWFQPQQYASPARVRAQVWFVPAATCAKSDRPTTAAGAGDGSSEPIPSWPTGLVPKQCTAPLRLSAQTCTPSAATSTQSVSVPIGCGGPMSEPSTFCEHQSVPFARTPQAQRADAADPPVADPCGEPVRVRPHLREVVHAVAAEQRAVAAPGARVQAARAELGPVARGPELLEIARRADAPDRPCAGGAPQRAGVVPTRRDRHEVRVRAEPVHAAVRARVSGAPEGAVRSDPAGAPVLQRERDVRERGALRPISRPPRAADAGRAVRARRAHRVRVAR